MKRKLLILITLTILFLFPINIYAGNGDVSSYYDSNSDMLIIGDSRIYEMSKKVGKASYVAVWGGHYGYGGSKMQIDYSSRVNDMKNYIDKIVKKYGYARVYVVATINDYNGTGSPNNSVNYQVSLINKLKNYNKNATLYGCSLIGSKTGASVNNYNNLLESKANSNDFTYLYIKPDSVSYSDEFHFKDSTTEAIFNKMNNTKSSTTGSSGSKTTNTERTTGDTTTHKKSNPDHPNLSTYKTNTLAEPSNICTQEVKDKAHYYWAYIMVMAPIGLMILISVDFVKAITSGKPDALKKSGNDAVKRAIACIILLMLPFLLGTIFSWFSMNFCF